MIIADKISMLRKKHNLSQEELAEKLNISRQSVSKWESAQSIPEISKVLAMAELFQVTTDYLLKDEQEELQYTDETKEVVLSLEEVNDYLNESHKHNRLNAIAVSLCIMSPSLLVVLSLFSSTRPEKTQMIFVAIGMLWLFLSIVVAVGLFIFSESLVRSHTKINDGDFKLSYGVEGIVKEKYESYYSKKTMYLVMSIGLFILSPISIILTGMFESDGGDGFVYGISMLILFICIAVGVHILILSEGRNANYETLLQIGEHSKEYKELEKKRSPIANAYWLITTALYLGWSFLTHRWYMTWIIWPIAGILYAAIVGFINVKDDNSH